MASLKYRSDIDGLRAIAVLGVVIFHAFPQNLPGGFVGVDIFFVISGYLISGILYKGHREGGFSFKEFYARRIRRLFPALITMLVLSLAYGWVILLPDEFEQMGKHIAAGTLFIQNFVFWGESGYFDTAANLKPMLHLWSLAVEEQFYIIFPLVLIVLWKRPKTLVPAMVTMLVGSFVINVVMSYQAAMTDFFLTPYRAWEFLAGSLLAWWHEERVEKLGRVARGQGVLDGKAPARENPPAGFDRTGNTARRDPLSSPEGLGGFSSWPVSDQAGQARCGDCHSPPSLAKLENPHQRDPSEFLHTLSDKGHEEEVTKWREAMSWGGGLLLAAGMILLSKQQGAYPGWRALLPVGGTCLLIEGGRGAWVNRRILSHPGLVWIGLISYPLYLFHWPILSFLHIVKGEKPSDGYLIGAIGLSFLLATLTYYLVEKKIRHNASRLTLPILIALFAAVGVLGYLGEKGLIKTNACRFGLDENMQASRENNYFDDFKREKLGFNYSRYTYGAGSKKTLYVGDSHMEQYAPRIRTIMDQGKAGDRGAVFLTRGGFLPIYGIVTTDKPGDIGFSKELFESTLDPSVDRVVVCANWSYYFNTGGATHLAHNQPMDKPEGMDSALGNLESFLQSLQGRGIHTYLVLNMPGSMGYDPKLMIQRGLLGGFSISESRLTAREFLETRGSMTCTQGDLMNRMRAIAGRTGTTIIDPMPVMAPDGVCVRFEGKKPIYHDLAHLTSSYVRKHASFMDPTISKKP